PGPLEGGQCFDRPYHSGRPYRESSGHRQCPGVGWPMNLAGDSLIQVTEFHKAYRGTVAVEALSFAVRPGEIMGLLGPNGAGKTTTMRAIAGIIPPTRGRLIVAGHDVTTEPVATKRELAYVPDEPRLFDALTVWEHLQFI